jgi:plastocyanin
MRKVLYLSVAVLALSLPASGSAASIQVTIKPAGFTPRIVTVNTGDTINWKNADNVNHQLVANNGAFASPIMKPGDWYHFTFNAAGKINYHDALHSSVTGTITVKGPPPSVSLAVSAPIVAYGGQTMLSGTVSNGKPNQTVYVIAQPYGSSVQQIAALGTGTGGAFSYMTTPTVLTNYYVKWGSANSATVVVQVRPQLTLTRQSRTRFYAKTNAGSHSLAGRSIYFQKHSPFGQWVTIAKLKLGPLGGRIFTVPHQKGTVYYRVYMTTNQAGLGYLDTWSNAAKVTFTK